MASGRFLSTTIADDDRLSRLSLEAEFLFLKTIPHLDRDGLITGKPGLLFSRVCPAREELFPIMTKLIDQLVNVGLVIRFDSEMGPVLFFAGFGKNNRLPHYQRERPSRFPEPPGYARSENGLISLLDRVPDKVQDSLLDKVQDGVHRKGAKVDAEDQVKDQEEEEEEEGERESGYAAPPPPSIPAAHELDESTLKPGQLIYKVVCEIVGWDYKTLPTKSQVQVAAVVKKLMAANYTCQELERFMGEVWALDWRWTKKKQRPTLEEFQAEVGKLHAGAAQMKRDYSGGYDRASADDAERRKQYSQYNDLLPKLPKGKP